MYLLTGFAVLLVGVYLVFKQDKVDHSTAAIRAGDPT